MAESSAITMTTNEEIDAFECGDNTIEITAYVDSIEGMKYVGKNKALFKFILNNGSGRRLKVLLWEQNAITYERKIVNREIVRIERGLYIPVNKTYYRKEENVIPFELSLSRNSKIHLLGQYITNNTPIPQIVCTTIKDCANVEGKLSLNGFIKVKFVQIATTNNSYGSGAIVDDIYKLRIHISNYCDNDALIEGAHIKVIGELKTDKYDSIYLHVEDVNNIELIDDVVLSHTELRRGIHAPRKNQKRRMECDDKLDDNQPNKKQHLNTSEYLSDSSILSQLSFEIDN